MLFAYSHKKVAKSNRKSVLFTGELLLFAKIKRPINKNAIETEQTDIENNRFILSPR